jgi:hypothetical protein
LQKKWTHIYLYLCAMTGFQLVRTHLLNVVSCPRNELDYLIHTYFTCFNK